MKIDDSGWADVARHHGRTVFSAVREMAGDDDSAWDCVQEAFVTALRRGVAEVEEPVSWLCGVAKNHARNLRRSRRRWWGFLGRMTHRREVAATPASTQDDCLSRALSRLPASQREAVVLRYLGEMSFAEVAAAQRVSADAAKARVHRGLKRLRRALGTSAVLTILVRAAVAGTERKQALLAAAKASAATALTLTTAAQFLLPFLLVAAGYVAFHYAPGSPPPAPPAETLTASLLPINVPAQKAPGAVPKGMNRVVFRNLLDGSPLPDFEVKIGSRAFTSDSDGAIEIRPTMAPTAPVAANWRLGNKPNEALVRGGTLWFCRKIKVRGRVTVPADSGLPPSEVSIWWRFKDESRAGSSAGMTDDWREAWHAMNLLDRGRRKVRAEPDGTFEIDTFALKNLYLSAYARGWMAAAADVPITEEGYPGEVALAIKDPAIRLHGKVRGKDGAPLRGLSIMAFVTERMSSEEYRRTPYPLPGHGLTAGFGKTGGHVTHHAGGRTGPHGGLDPGQFDFYIGIPGEILIVVYPPGGYAAVEHRITRAVGDNHRLRIPLRFVGEDVGVTLTSGGRPIGPGQATFHDFSLDGPQTTIRLDVGRGGRMPTALLTAGHRYRVDFRASAHPFRYLEWEPVDRLEIDDLPLTPPGQQK